MSEYIKKDDAIEAFREEWERIMPHSDRYMIKRSFIAQALKTIPPADVVERQTWIPCSERLPERQGYYICTCKDGTKDKRTTPVKWSNGWQLSGARAYWIVLAWMPLPPPYKVGEREGE